MRARMPAFPALRGGELALVSLTLLGELEGKPRLDRLVAQLSTARVSGIILLEVAGGAEHHEPLGAAVAAEEYHLPVFMCPPGHTAESIDAALHRYLVGERETLFRRSQQLQQEFTSLAFTGQGLPAILDRLAAVSGLPAVWEDRELELRAWAAPVAGEQRLPDGVSDLTAVLRAARLPALRWARTLPPDSATEASTLPLRADSAASAQGWKRLIVPFTAGSQVNGYLSLIGHNGDITAEARAALAAAGLAASIEALRMRAVSEAEERASTSLLRDWISGRFESASELATRLRQFGHTPEPPFAVLVLERSDPFSAEELGRIATAVCPARAGQTGSQLSASLDENRTALILAGVDEQAVGPAAEHVHALFQAREEMRVPEVQARTRRPEPPVFAGIGRAVSRLEDVPRAYREAGKALAIARRLGGRHRVAHFGSLGVYRILAAVQSEELRHFYDDTLGALVAHDRKTGGDLMRTLETYVECGGSLIETAERLHTHRNTVLYRIERIVEVLRMDVRQPEQRLLLHLALRSANVLGDQRAEEARGGTSAA